MAVLPNFVNADLSRGFIVPQVAKKHACPVAPVDGTGVGPEDRTGGWPEPMVWSVILEGKTYSHSQGLGFTLARSPAC